MKTNIINNVLRDEGCEDVSQDAIMYDYWANHFCFCLEDEFDDPIENAHASKEVEITDARTLKEVGIADNYYLAAS
ncbi:MAG TPA: hypothetical protein VN721_05010 [Flavipsychrobacter sp.]|nr:hypothetical protein [Flavipsychrobacter sp.]